MFSKFSEDRIDAMMALRPKWGVAAGGRPVGSGKKDEEEEP